MSFTIGILADGMYAYILERVFCSFLLVLQHLYYQHKNMLQTSYRFKFMRDLQVSPRSVELQQEEERLHCVQPNQLSTTTLPNHWALTLSGIFKPLRFRVVCCVALFKWRFINIKFLSNTIHLYYIYHSVNSKKIHTGMKLPLRSRHKTFLSPQKSLHSSRQSFSSTSLSPCQSLICMSS